jgi:hypothetical protein
VTPERLVLQLGCVPVGEPHTPPQQPAQVGEPVVLSNPGQLKLGLGCDLAAQPVPFGDTPQASFVPHLPPGFR